MLKEDSEASTILAAVRCCVTTALAAEAFDSSNLYLKELVHFRFCRQENPEGNFQNRIQLFFMKLLQGWLNLIILS